MSTIFPGDELHKNYIGEDGMFLKDGISIATIAGKMNLDNNRINIQPFFEDISSKQVIKVGSIIMGQVVKINMNQVNVEIVGLGEQVLKETSKGLIRREDIKQSEIDTLIIRDCFRPGDIIYGQVISLGDTKQYYLSTAAPNLGVVLAKCQANGNIMKPLSYNVIINLKYYYSYFFPNSPIKLRK